MKEQIENILIKVDEGTIPVQQALSELLLLFSVRCSLPTDLIKLQNQWLEDGDRFEGKEVEGRYSEVYVSRKELDFVHKQQRRQ